MASKTVACPECSQEIRVPDASRRRLKCPTCSHRFAVGGDDRPAAWYVRTTDGRQLGPVPDAELDQWLVDGRLTGDCELRAREWKEWRYADAVFPSLAEPAAAEPAAGDPISEGEFSLEALARLDESRRPKRSTRSQRSAGLETTIPGIHRVMVETRPWTMLAAANGFVLFGIGTFLLTLRIISGVSSGNASVTATAIGGILLLTACCLGPALLLLKVHGRIKSFVEKNDYLSLQWALEGQRQWAKALAILPFVGVAILVVVAFAAYGSGAYQ